VIEGGVDVALCSDLALVWIYRLFGVGIFWLEMSFHIIMYRTGEENIVGTLAYWKR